MIFDWTTALAGLAGGMMIGGSAAFLLLALGRIAGISGIMGTSLGPRRGAEGLAFLAGLIGVPALAVAIGQGPEITIAASPAVLVLAGLLVGIGTRMGNGCTSGHGVCGLSRLSRRSLVSVAVFMGVAALTASLTA